MQSLVRIAFTVAMLTSLAGIGRAQTSVTFDATSGSSTITTPYSTAGGLTISLGFFGDYLVVGGGGASGGIYPGGGGGGQVLSGSGTQITSATSTVVVGGGGAWESTSGSAASGGSSSFLGMTAIGGGGGNGGTGAGGTSGSGFTGGTRSSGYSGGGGGQTGRGSSGNSGTPIAGNGGAGLNSTITGSTLMYGFGGSGGSLTASGASAQNGDGTITNPRANSGGGGRRVSGTTPGNAGTGRGATGIVILRYAGSDATGVTGGTAATGTGSAAGFMLQQFTTTGTISGTSTLAIDFDARLAATLTGTISGGSDGMTFNGPGRLTLAGGNSYSGLTTISAGVIALSGTGSIGTGGLSIAAGTRFDIGGLTSSTYTLPATGNLVGSGTISGSDKTLAVLGIFLPGSSDTGTISLASGLTLDLSASAGSTFTLTSPNFTAGTFDHVTGDGGIVFGGMLSLDFRGGAYLDGPNVVQLFANTGGRSGSFSAIAFTGLGAGQSVTFDGTTGFVSIVPEPSTSCITLAGLACGGWVVWRPRARSHRRTRGWQTGRASARSSSPRRHLRSMAHQ
ncbi:MAG: glycine-rich domain-containing protein [Planctomycetaceae bacterium]